MHSLDPTGDTSSVVQDLMDIWLWSSCWCAGKEWMPALYIMVRVMAQSAICLGIHAF